MWVRGKFLRWCGGRFAGGGLVVLVCVLMSPSLFQGYFLDDYSHRLCFLGHSDLGPPSQRPVMEMFAFVRDEGHLRACMEKGYAPWWSTSGLRLSFWRPLAALSHAIDYRLWPDGAVWMHLHNVLWFALLVWVLLRLYRRWLGEGWVAGAAAFCFATYGGFAMPVTWIANRNGLMAVFWGVIALWGHDRWRAEGWRWGAVVGGIGVSLSVLSAEAGIATGAYLFAYACFLDRRGWLRGGLALWPYAVVVIGWRVVYRALGYGVVGTTMYVDPLLSPVAFVSAVVERLPILWMSLWAVVPSSAYVLLSRGQQGLVWGMGVLVSVWVCWMLWPLRSSKVVRCLGLGMFLSILPVCAVFPDDRSLFFVAIGGMGLLALLFQRRWEPAKGADLSRFWGASVGILAALHLVISPLSVPLRTQMTTLLGRAIEEKARSFPMEGNDNDRVYVLLNSSASLLDLNVQLYRAFLYPPTYRSLHILGPGLRPVRVLREDAYTLRLRPDGGFVQVFDALFRGTDRPMRVGEKVRIKLMDVEVVSLLSDGRPSEARFRFRVPLEDPRLVFLTGGKTALLRWKPPTIGGHTILQGGPLFPL